MDESRTSLAGHGGQARLDDVATRAGVAKSTVSRVMSGEATLAIREETRQRILEAATALGYSPDSRGRALRLKRSYTLGIVVPEIDNPAFGAIIRSAQRAAIERGYSLFISLADKDQPDADLYRRLVEGSRVDGVLVTTVSDAAFVAELRRRSVKYLLVNREIDGEPNSIIVDYVDGTEQAVAHLAGLGHRHFGLVSGPLHQYAGRKRVEGFRRGLAKAGLQFDATCVAECNYGWSEAGEAFVRLMELGPKRPTAICAANTTVASGIIAKARSLGLSVPDDLSLVSLLDAPLSVMQVPAISAVQYPFEELGQLAVSRLIEAIEHGTASMSARLPPSGLILRETTAAAPARA
jgi:DNA-binding LacI/PurR family transcriptional regulator